MLVLRRATLRAVSSASQSLLSTPRAARYLTTRAAAPFRQPLVPSPFFQRRFISDDASKEVEATEQEGSAEPAAAEPAAERATAPAPPREGTTTLYFGNLFFEVTKDELEAHAAAIGPVKSVKVVQDARGLSKGFGFVEFENTQDAATAIETLDQTVLNGRRLTVQWHIPRQSNKVTRGANKPTSTLFIGNMSFEMSDKELNDLFRQVRNVIDVRVAIDRRTGQPRGFAHADFTDVESAAKAKEYLAGMEIHNRKLVADFAISSRDVQRPDGETSEAI